MHDDLTSSFVVPRRSLARPGRIMVQQRFSCCHVVSPWYCHHQCFLRHHSSSELMFLGCSLSTCPQLNHPNLCSCVRGLFLLLPSYASECQKCLLPNACRVMIVQQLCRLLLLFRCCVSCCCCRAVSLLIVVSCCC